MSLREKLSGIKTDQLADLADIMEIADGIEADLENANSVIAERDKTISELKEQNNKLYARMILTETGGKEEEEPKTWEDMEGDEALQAFLESKEGKELWQ